MAQNKVTRANATTEIVEFAKANGYDNAEVLEVMDKIVASFNRKPAEKQVSKARIKNENVVEKLWKLAQNVDSFTWKWAVENLNDPEVQTSQKIVAIMRLGIELGKFEKIKDGKNTLYKSI